MNRCFSAVASCLAICLLLAGCSGNRAGSESVPLQITAQNDPGPAVISTAEPENPEENTSGKETAEQPVSSGAPVVYFTSDISAAGLVKIYDALGWTPDGNVAVKISTGEPPAPEIRIAHGSLERG